MRVCAEHDLTVTPQGGNTGLVGGGVPGTTDARRSIILQLGRLQQIHDIDAVNRTVTVDAGVVLQSLHDSLSEQGLHLPMHLGSQGTAQIGGLLSTNAGGSHVLRYGMMESFVLGLDVVLADGSRWQGDRALLKDNAGYPLRRLFCGAEGTLGVITRAVLRVYPKPVATSTALLAFNDLQAAVGVGARLRSAAGDLVSALEFMTDVGIDLLQAHVDGITVPFDPLPAVLLLVLDGVLATNDTQRQAFWRLREEMPEGQRRAGAQIKHDVAVPVNQLATFIDTASSAVAAILPGVRVNPFGHLGDGNVHFNLSPPVSDPDAFATHAKSLSTAIYDCAVASGGTIAAEHGLGQDKVHLANHYRGTVERQLMRSIKQALDPNNQMNPGKVV